MKTKPFKTSLFYLLLVVVLAPLSTTGQSLSVEAKIMGSSNRKAFLSVRGDAGKNFRLVDSTVSVGDRFAFTHRLEELNLYRITIEEVRGALRFIWDSNVRIEGDSKAIWQSQISGSPLTDELRRYDREFTDPARERVIALSNQMREPNLAPEKRETLGRQQREVVEALLLQAEKYITEHPKSFLSLLFLTDIWESVEPDKVNQILKTFDQEMRTHSLVKAMLEGMNIKKEEAKLRETVNAGNPAPNFTAHDLKGNEVVLANLRGQYVLLDFWGSWCGPCIKLIPETKAAFRKYQGKKVQFVGVAYDKESDRAKLNGLIERHGMEWPQIFQDMSDESKSPVVHKYLVYNYPSVILINPNGDIIYRGIGQDGLVEACQVLDKELGK